MSRIDKTNQMDQPNKTFSSQPECLTITVDDAATILGISRSSAYTLAEQAFKEHKWFKVLRIGKSYRILRESFYSYILDGVEVSA
ncbi:MAG: helix-turn-helix domain-containing protein [Oscillospiraceae bacterium]|nr:helix-turn-helix domain-containing protein [Oscillospiraceae bacterium]